MKEDDRQTKGEKFVASNSQGLSFRQVGTGRSIHFIISFKNVCNVHIDSIGFVDSCGYDVIRALGHGYWDLAPDIVPGAFFSFGETGVGGIMVAPMKGVDGVVRPVVGIGGRWYAQRQRVPPVALTKAAGFSCVEVTVEGARYIWERSVRIT
jgi:hypothetical protein